MSRHLSIRVSITGLLQACVSLHDMKKPQFEYGSVGSEARAWRERDVRVDERWRSGYEVVDTIA